MTSDSAFFLFFLARILATAELVSSPQSRRKPPPPRSIVKMWHFMFCYRTHSNVAAMGAESACNAIAADSRALIRLSGGTHLIVSGSISFKWFDDAWKMLLLLMFMLFSLLHRRIVDISAQSTALKLFFRPFFTCQSKNVIHSCVYRVDCNVLLFMHSNFH